MKIVNIVPGFGGTFYCGNCLRDSAYVRSLKEMGHDAVTLPVYLPLTRNGAEDQDGVPVFYGAVNIYLKQQFPIFRKMPHWMEHLLNSAPILKFASYKAGSTRAEGLEELTESMLLGEEGFQSAELQEMVNYLKYHEKPDIVHFSNALLLGMAKKIREELKIPVVCSLQDEDVWVDAMKENYREKIWQLLAEKARDIDAFVAVSHYFAGIMKKKLNIPDSKLTIIHIGIKPELYDYHPPVSDPRVIGYLSRICKENGFAVLVDAFIRLKTENNFHDLKLKVIGGMTGDDKPFIREQWNKLKENNLDKDVEILPDFTYEALKDFFRSISVLSVPVLKGEAFGLYQIEALASGIPLVQPDIGAFPEVIKASGGGMIYHPNDPETLAKSLAQVLSDRVKLLEMSKSGRKAVEEKFDCRKLTDNMLELYKKLLKNPL